jgi:hypothetical protein
MLTSSLKRSDTKTTIQPVANTSVWLWVIALALSSLPVANIAHVLATCGVDNLCNDYLQYAGLIDRIMSGNYNWLNFISDTFYRTHSVAAPVALHLACARFFHLSVYPELASGFVFALARLIILYAVLARPLKGWLRPALLPALSALVFSSSQMSVFCYGDGALTIELSLLGFALVLGGLALEGYSGDALIFAGGTIASFSWGNGLVAWLMAATGLAALGRRQAISYLTLLAGFALSLAPYVNALVVAPLSQHGPARVGTTPLTLLNLRFISGALGFPFANDIAAHAEGLAAARTIGWLGLAASLAGLILIAGARDKALVRKATPALLCVIHGLVSLWQISVFRSLIAPWYTAPAATFWIGLLALAPLVYQELAGGRTGGSPWLKGAARAWCVLVPLFMAIVYLSSNLTYEDKDTLLFARSPASASALRHWRNGPTYGEQYVFQWGGGNPGLLGLLAAPLEKHNLSVFAPHQLWTLQGDFLLDDVKYFAPASSYTPFWSAGVDRKERLPWWHNKHLNLVLPAPDSVSWSFVLPDDLASAELCSRAIISAVGGGKPTLLSVHVKSEGASERMVYNFLANKESGKFQEFKVPLTEYRGKKITIRFGCAGPQGAAGVFYYPVVEIVRAIRQGEKSQALGQEPTPSNCYPQPAAAGASPADLCFETSFPGPDSGDRQEVIAHTAAGVSATQLMISEPSDTRISDYSHFALTLSLSPKVSPRMVAVTLQTDSASPTFQVPLVADGATHTYTYDLKLLELAPGTRIKGASLALAGQSEGGQGNTLSLADVRLVRKRP